MASQVTVRIRRGALTLGHRWYLHHDIGFVDLVYNSFAAPAQRNE